MQRNDDRDRAGTLAAETGHGVPRGTTSPLDGGRAADARRRLELLDDVRERPPWRPEPVPPSAVDLAQLALWCAGRAAETDPVGEDALDGLALVAAAHEEVDSLEAALVLSARAAGHTWSRIADAMGFNSPQACQQHVQRLARRRGRDA